jgi:hypothetical protein
MKHNDRKLHRVRALLWVMACLTVLSVLPVSAAEPTDIYTTWIATDALGRTTPTYEEAGAKKENAYVGIFYFMFMDPIFDTKEIIDFSAAYRKGGAQAVWNSAVTGGFHIWAEPYFGYYLNTDEWILRKHAYMLSEAGVDFIYLDVTNNSMYQHCWETIFRVWKQIRDEGQDTPDICFSFGKTMYPDNMEIVWDKIYTPNQNGEYEYENLWFMWEGKPLIFGDFSQIDKEISDFFTVRTSWAYEEEQNGQWPWIQLYPQGRGLSPTGEFEQMAVAAGFHANSSHGRSLWVDDSKKRVEYKQTVNGKLDFGYSLDETAYGLAFAQQWSYAIEKSPKIVMLTGWNEFTFGKHVNAGIGQTISSMYTIIKDDPIQSNNYIDAMTAEYSRDIEPIKGQFGDNYFYQMAYYIRLFKGTDPIPESTATFEVNMAGDLSELDQIQAIYRDVAGDITHRDSPSLLSSFYYVNETGRNDLVSAKVSKTTDFVYFCVDCAADITTPEGENWMNLFVNADRSYETGWEGYDFIINRSRENGKCTVERFSTKEWDEAIAVGEADYTVVGNRMVIRVSSSLLCLDGRDSFDFKWADNSTTVGDPMEFLDLGDSAPNDRYRFRYILTGGTYSDELLTTVPEGEETESESESEGEAPTEDITETPSDTDTETTAPVVNGSVDGSLSRVSFGSAAKGLWMIFLGADLLLAILIVCILIKNKKGSAV